MSASLSVFQALTYWRAFLLSKHSLPSYRSWCCIYRSRSSRQSALSQQGKRELEISRSDAAGCEIQRIWRCGEGRARPDARFLAPSGGCIGAITRLAEPDDDRNETGMGSGFRRTAGGQSGARLVRQRHELQSAEIR